MQESKYKLSDKREHTPSYERNIAPIEKVLRPHLENQSGTLLEIGSGSGQHVNQFAKAFNTVTFQPTEYSADSLRSIDAWTQHFSAENIRPALQLDVSLETWPFEPESFDWLLAVNVIHYSPWATTPALFQGAAKYLNENGKIIFYGPYRMDGEHTAPSNVNFEQWLKNINPEFGVRDLGEVEEIAKANGFKLIETHTMPANNFMPVFARTK